MLSDDFILPRGRKKHQLSAFNDSNLTRSVKSDIVRLPDSLDLGICPVCGTSDLLVSPGTGPHAARLDCDQCRRFIKWLGRDKAAQLAGLVAMEEVQ